MTPVWVFPAYPLLLTAPFGGNLVSAASRTGRLDAVNAVAVATAAVTVQGTGFLISFMINAAFLYRLMTQKLPRDHQRPGVFISIGPSGFTAAGLGTFCFCFFFFPFPFPPQKVTHTDTNARALAALLGGQAAAIFPDDFMGAPQRLPPHVVPAVLQTLAYMAALWMWGLSVWFFLVSVGSLWKYLRPENKAKLRFQMTWFSFVFPNTALVGALPPPPPTTNGRSRKDA